MGLFSGKKYDISDLGDFNTQVLQICLELIINSGPAYSSYAGIDTAVKSGKLTKKQMEECISLVVMFRDLVVSQPELATSFGGLTFNGTIEVLNKIIAIFEGKI